MSRGILVVVAMFVLGGVVLWGVGLCENPSGTGVLAFLEGGEGGIRTLGTVARTPVFETGPIDRSGTSPGDTE